MLNRRCPAVLRWSSTKPAGPLSPAGNYLGLRPSRPTPRAADARNMPAATLARRRDAGYQSNSLAWVGMRGDVIAWTRQYLRIPAAPPNRVPTPECFQPPIGRSRANPFDMTSLMLTPPTSSLRATRSPRSLSPVHTVADSPYSES